MHSADTNGFRRLSDSRTTVVMGLFAFLPLTQLTTAVAGEAQRQDENKNEPSIVISPRPVKLSNDPSKATRQTDSIAQVAQADKAAPKVAVKDAPTIVIVPQAYQRPTYYQIYSAIPFLRSEYEASPSYRHDATMEIMFGRLRPTTILKYTPVAPPAPSSIVTPYRYSRRGYGVNYHFYYPRPSGYRRY